MTRSSHLGDGEWLHIYKGALPFPFPECVLSPFLNPFCTQDFLNHIKIQQSRSLSNQQ